MRRLLPVLLAALVACQVDVEGAPCEIADHCPSGQGCGLDKHCSKRAASAECALRTPGERRCNETMIEEFSADPDPICGAWVPAMQQCGSGLVCSDKTGAPRCDCAEVVDGIFWADPAGGGDATLIATGALNPPTCRLRRLTDALAAAKAHAEAHPDTGAVVRAYGESATFGVAETEEAFPLEIAPGVVLSTAAAKAGAPDPASWIIRADTSSSTDVVTLHDGAGIEGFTVASVSAAGDVVRLSCASRTKATLNSVIVDGGRVAAYGVEVVGPCDVEATDLSILQANEAGLLVDVDLASDTEPITGVLISGGAISDNGGNGAEVRAGRLGLFGDASGSLAVARNGGFGVLAKARDESPVAIALDVQFADVFFNGETGLVLRDLKPGSSAVVLSTDVHENKASSGLSEPVTGHRAGGAVIYGNQAVPLTLHGNRFYSNRYDQFAVISSALWNLSGENCNGGANVFACRDSETNGKLIYAVGSTDKQTVNFAQWLPFPPDASLLVGVATVVPCPEQSRVPAVCPDLP